MSKFAQWYLLGVVVPVLSIHLITILSTSNKSNKTSSNHDSGECVLISRRECQITPTGLIATTSPTTTKTATALLPSLLGVDLAESGRTTGFSNRGA